MVPEANTPTTRKIMKTAANMLVREAYQGKKDWKGSMKSDRKYKGKYVMTTNKAALMILGANFLAKLLVFIFSTIWHHHRTETETRSFKID